MPRAKERPSQRRCRRTGENAAPTVLGSNDMPDDNHLGLFKPNPDVTTTATSNRVLRDHRQLELGSIGHHRLTYRESTATALTESRPQQQLEARTQSRGSTPEHCSPCDRWSAEAELGSQEGSARGVPTKDFSTTAIAPSTGHRASSAAMCQSRLKLGGLGYDTPGMTDGSDGASQIFDVLPMSQLETGIAEGRVVAVELRNNNSFARAHASHGDTVTNQCRRAFARFTAQHLSRDLVNIRTYHYELGDGASVKLAEHISSYLLTYESSTMAKKAEQALVDLLRDHIGSLAWGIDFTKPSVPLSLPEIFDIYRPDPGDVEKACMLDELRTKRTSLWERKSTSNSGFDLPERMRAESDSDVQTPADPSAPPTSSQNNNIVALTKAFTVVIRSKVGITGDVTDVLRQKCRERFARFVARWIANGWKGIRTFQKDIDLSASGKDARQDHLVSYLLIYENKAGASKAQRVVRAKLKDCLLPCVQSVSVARTRKLTEQAAALRPDASTLEMDIVRQVPIASRDHTHPEAVATAIANPAPVGERRKRKPTEQQTVSPPQPKKQKLDFRSILPVDEQHPQELRMDPEDVPISELLAQESGNEYVAHPDLCRSDDWEHVLTNENTLVLAVGNYASSLSGANIDKVVPQYCIANFAASLTRILQIEKSSVFPKLVMKDLDLEKLNNFYLLGFATGKEAKDALQQIQVNSGLGHEGWTRVQAIAIDPHDAGVSLHFRKGNKLQSMVEAESKLIWRARNGIHIPPNQWRPGLKIGNVETTSHKHYTQLAKRLKEAKSAKVEPATDIEPRTSNDLPCSTCGGDHQDEDCSRLWRTYDPANIDVLRTVKKLTLYCCACGAGGHLADDCKESLHAQHRYPGKNDIFSAAFTSRWLLSSRSRWSSG